MLKKSFGLVGAASFILLATGAIALAQGVGNPGSLPTVFPQNTPSGWDIGPYAVELDPAGPVWSKVLTDPSGGPVTGTVGTTYSLHEQLIVSGTLPWKDWHEQITTIGWEWQQSSSIFANGAPVGGFNAVYTPATSASGGSVDFSFNSLAPGTVVDIFKTLQFAGQVGQFNTGTIDIHEFPTPEPASLLMLTLGSAMVLKRRRGCLIH
jgi:hypothetical protein